MKTSKQNILKKTFGSKVVSKNQKSFDDFSYYRKIMDNLEKIKYPVGKTIVYKPLGANSSNTVIKLHDTITTA